MEPGRPSNSLHFAVGELSGKLDQLLTLVPAHQALTSRVTKLEIWQGRTIGVGTVLVFIVPIVVETVRHAFLPAAH